MKPLYIVANWKSNKTSSDAIAWFRGMQAFFSEGTIPENVHIVLCVPFTLLLVCKDQLQALRMPIELGAQNVSLFTMGAYTGEVSAQMVKEFAKFVIIGHSERRRYFHETDEEISQKSLKAKEAGLTTICCIGNKDAPIPDSADLVGFEPESAIGNGQPMNADEAERICNAISTKANRPVLYGGSVTENTVTSFLVQPHINGVLVGGASLKPEDFCQIIAKASSV